MSLIEAHLPLSGKVCIDCGANVGKWTRPLAKIFDKVIAIEPDYRAFEINKGKLPKNAEIIHAAVGRESGRAEFSVMPQMMHSYLGKSPKAIDVVFVKMVQLDEFVNYDVDFVKIDVEGAEVDVLAGGLELFRIRKPIVVVETHNTYEEVKELVGNMGYVAHAYGEPLGHQLVCLPKEAPVV